MLRPVFSITSRYRCDRSLSETAILDQHQRKDYVVAVGMRGGDLVLADKLNHPTPVDSHRVDGVSSDEVEL